MPQRVIPLGEIFEIGIDAAVAESCRRGALVGFFQRAIFIGMAEGAIRDFVFVFLKNDGVIHFQRRKNSFTQKLAVGFS